MLGNRFIRSVAILSGTSLAAQAINLIAYIILPVFFYGPEDFGVFGLFLAIYYVLFELVNLKMDQSVMLPESDRDAAGLLGFSCLVAAGLSAGIGVLLMIGCRWIGSINVEIALLLPVSLVFGGWLQPMLVWFNRRREYVWMGTIRMVQAVVTLVVSTAAWYLSRELVNGLIVGFIAGQLSALAMAAIKWPWHDWHIAGGNMVRRYAVFMRYGSLSSMVSALSRNLPVFFIRPLFGDATLGGYTLATKYLNAPTGIFSAAVGQVYYREASTAAPGELRKLTRSVVRSILGMAAIPALVIMFTGAGLFHWVFGPEWEEAGRMMQVLVAWYYVAYASSPVSMLLDVKLKLRWELVYNILLLSGRAAALASVFLWNDVMVVLAVYAAVGILFNVLLMRYILQLTDDAATA